MRNWIIITALGIAVGVGGLVYYVFPKVPDSQPGILPQVNVQPEQRTGNPLLIATRGQINMWFPSPCLAELYFNPSKDGDMKDICINGVSGRVESSTGVLLNRSDILNPSVVKHISQIMGVK